ncbi:helix-turn-helix domain-containing protein [Desulfovibrio sp. 6_1_46AFAA]|uniref:helix-turn-helix domain-containing protein n=1 Tax=Desulfovibrio sp. 6_1_46AFAA TaxID=665942 RepID=UPI001E4E51E5|nr:helix-turn-helix transcriptional regulator [Desulfovibrio sp. 6_1_46AFAA]
MKSELQTTKSPHGDMEPKVDNFFGKALLQIRLRLGAVSKLGFSFSAKKGEPWAAGVYSNIFDLRTGRARRRQRAKGQVRNSSQSSQYQLAKLSGISEQDVPPMIESNVKNIMKNMHITYAELESVTGLSSQTITRARSRRIREMSLETLETIAHALGVTIKDLFDERVVSHKKQTEQDISQRSSPQNED